MQNLPRRLWPLAIALCIVERSQSSGHAAGVISASTGPHRPGPVAIDVVNGNRRAVPQARISLWLDASRPQPPQITTTDRNGRADFTEPAPGSYVAMATHSATGSALAAFEVAGDSVNQVFMKLEVLGPVAGRVVDREGHALQASIHPVAWARHPLPAAVSKDLAVSTSRDGRFAVRPGAPGDWLFTVTAARHLPAVLRLAAAAGRPIRPFGDVVLEPVKELRGVVRSWSGDPIAGARVSARPSNPMLPAPLSEDLTGKDGRFALTGLNAGLYVLRVRAHGFVPSSTTAYGGEESTDIALSEAARIEGAVVDDAGAIVRSYSVLLAAEGPNDGGVESKAPASVESDDGRFVLDDVVPGQYALRFVSTRGTRAISGVTAIDGATNDVGVVVLVAGRMLTGSVAESDGAPVQGATVRLRPPAADPERAFERLSSTTDALGQFDMSIPPARDVVLAATHPDYAPAAIHLIIDPDRDPPAARLVLSHGGTIRGTAKRSDGAPLKGFPVSAASGSQIFGGSTTAPDGSFVLDHIPAGPATVNLAASDGSGRETSLLSRRVEVRDDQITLVDFVSSEVFVSGRILHGNTPLAGAALRFWNSKGTAVTFDWGSIERSAGDTGTEVQRMFALSTYDGSFDLIVDSPGRYLAQIQSADGRTTYPIQVVDVPPVARHHVDILLTGAPVSGTVLDQEGRPLAGATIVATPATGPQADLVAETGVDGGFSMTIPPGAYVLVVRANRHHELSVAMTLDSLGVSGLRLVLTRAETGARQ